MRSIIAAAILFTLAQPAWAKPIELLCYDPELGDRTGGTKQPENMLELLDTLTEKFNTLNSTIGVATSGLPERYYLVYTLDIDDGFFGIETTETKERMPFLGIEKYKIKPTEKTLYTLKAVVEKDRKVNGYIDRVTGVVDFYVYEWRNEKNEWDMVLSKDLYDRFGMVDPTKLKCRPFTSDLLLF